jgi:hypothetical protein
MYPLVWLPEPRTRITPLLHLIIAPETKLVTSSCRGSYRRRSRKAYFFLPLEVIGLTSRTSLHSIRLPLGSQLRIWSIHFYLTQTRLTHSMRWVELHSHGPAARGNSRHVAILLAHGADPNVLDIQWTDAVSYPAEIGHVICIRLLLEARAAPDPILPKGIMVGSALNCTARTTSVSHEACHGLCRCLSQVSLPLQASQPFLLRSLFSLVYRLDLPQL